MFKFLPAEYAKTRSGHNNGTLAYPQQSPPQRAPDPAHSDPKAIRPFALPVTKTDEQSAQL